MDKASKLKRKISILIGLSVVALAMSMIFLRGGLARASDEQPVNVSVTPNSSNSATVAWTTGNATQGQVLYSTDIDGADTNPNIAPEEIQTTTHSVELSLLEAGRTYYFKIKIGSTLYDNGGVAWTFTTPLEDGTTPSTNLPTRTVTTAAQLSVTPIQRLVIPGSNATSAPTVAPTAALSCNYTDCATIKTKLGKGCSSQDYLKCLRK